MKNVREKGAEGWEEEKVREGVRAAGCERGRGGVREGGEE